MPINYKVNTELEFLCALFYGIVDINDAVDYINTISADQTVKQTNKVLIYLKESELILNNEDVDCLTRKLALSTEFDGRDRISFLLDNPSDTVIATIFAQTLITLKKGVRVELFYNMEEALSFLELSDDKLEVEGMIDTQVEQLSLTSKV